MKIELSTVLLQIGIVLVCAKLSGFFFTKVLKVPSLLGELLAGVIIAPSNFVSFKPHLFFELFSPDSEYFQILKVLSEMGVAILLFYSGVEADKKKFFQYFFKAFVIGMGGVVVPFILCSGYIYFWLKSTGTVYTLQEVLFCGAIATATSIGITATILAEVKMLETIFGTAILVAAVVDDVLGLIVLSIVSGLDGSNINLLNIAVTSAKALGMWFLVGGGAFIFIWLLNKYLVRKFESSFLFVISIALAFLAGFLCEKVNLSAIVGTYVVGLAVAQTELAHKIEKMTLSVTEFLLPFFFFKIGLL
ncbi:MAG: cation:proton antiporter, partial [Planctomycetota bacterium]